MSEEYPEEFMVAWERWWNSQAGKDPKMVDFAYHFWRSGIDDSRQQDKLEKEAK